MRAIYAWLLDAWDILCVAMHGDGEQPYREPPTPAAEARRIVTAAKHDLPDHRPRVTGSITDLFDEPTRPTRPAIRPPPKGPR